MSLATRSIPRPVRILLLGEHAIIRAGLRMLLESRPEFTVVAEAATYRDLLAFNFEPTDIILVDLDLDQNNRLDFLPELIAAANGAPVLILTATPNLEAHYCAVRFGAMGLVLKERPAEVLIKAIEKVHAGEVWLDRSMVARVLGGISSGNSTQPDAAAADIATLTEREREVVSVIGEGLKNKQIAERLFISETTVRHHLTSIFDKLRVSDRFELLIYAYRHKLAKPPF